MPIALLAIGILFLVAAVRGKHEDLFSLIKDDFTGPNNFFYWVISIWVIGAVGYYKPLKPLSVAFLTLVIIILFLSNKGFFAKFLQQMGSTNSPSSADKIIDNPLQTGIGLGNVISGGALGRLLN